MAGIKIRRYRLAHSPRLTQEMFGTRFGVAKHTVAGWETEGKRARASVANQLAQAGVATHADWYMPGRCPNCEADADSKAASGCAEHQCPLDKLNVA